MIARLFFIIAMIFSLTEVIVMLSYKNAEKFSVVKSISNWVSKNYEENLSFDFDFFHKKSDKEIQKRILELSAQINLFDIEKEYDLPKGLLHAVMHQESAGNLNAVSRAGAVGPFQFMAPTARDFGLITNSGKDNRKNLYKSAIAAARYYRKLITYFDGNLTYAIAAYNAGEGRVLSTKGKLDKLPYETKNYIKRVNRIMKIYQQPLEELES